MGMKLEWKCNEVKTLPMAICVATTILNLDSTSFTKQFILFSLPPFRRMQNPFTVVSSYVNGDFNKPNIATNFISHYFNTQTNANDDACTQ